VCKIGLVCWHRDEGSQSVAAVAAKKLLVGKSLTELLEENADSVLGLACASGYIELVTVLLAINANVEERGPKSEATPLMEACAHGHAHIARLLLEHGADVEARAASGSSPLHAAAARGHAHVLRLLLAAGCRLEAANEHGHTPLMEAACGGHVECASLLLDAGAQVNAHSQEFKETALTLAAYKVSPYFYMLFLDTK
jgi:ankyrin repeat protein